MPYGHEFVELAHTDKNNRVNQCLPFSLPDAYAFVHLVYSVKSPFDAV